MTKVVAVVPAAGLGSRFAQGRRKTFHMLSGKPVVAHVLETFQNCGAIDEIVPVFRADELPEGEKIAKSFGITKAKTFVAGGRERQDSIYNALKTISDGNAVVAIHDGARPLITQDVIVRCISGLNGCDGVIAAVPVKDTIKEAVGSRQSAVDSPDEQIIVSKTLDRSVLWSVQTPQIFVCDRIKEAYNKAFDEGFYATDDAALLERYGGKVRMVMGDYKNIKITTAEDIPLAEALLKQCG
ncbi:MAG: 2-C-methyl-D-erythritol 4-phosphate cytidylyltransferase [Nitrospirae bacterium]|nr:MAG: 2-C-methyl-D-erythritol 4-phosphate cytidylyltransferase [Nitrospirota bacterium]